jgi:hypothetical protein
MNNKRDRVLELDQINNSPSSTNGVSHLMKIALQSLQAILTDL